MKYGVSLVWDAINNKLEKNKFRKSDLNTLIADHKIVENRQPVKAAVDVLEYLGYICKTGRKSGRSEEYEKTGKMPPIIGLDKYLE